jgi:hypothetical protein
MIIYDIHWIILSILFTIFTVFFDIPTFVNFGGPNFAQPAGTLLWPETGSHVGR